MSEDFYINYRCASQPNGATNPLLKEPPRERIDALRPILFELRQGNSDPGESHVCPICRHEMRLTFESYKETPRELDIASYCNTCNINVFFKSDKIPNWARAISIFDLPGFIDRENNA